MSTVLYESDISNLELIHRGKVRDVYNVDDQHLLIVASDRLSAFDVVLPQPIPGKGEVLTRVANFWFKRTAGLVQNHLSDLTIADVVPDTEQQQLLKERAVVTRKLKPLPVEAIARGYLIGSGWKDYQATGSLCGIALPEGLRQADQLPAAIFTPSTKAQTGNHDENITYQDAENLLGSDIAARVRDLTLEIYTESAAYARERGIIIADTKFEFGLDNDGELYLIDEILTPDSSRFWPADQYAPGSSPPSFDKQFVRDYLETLDWDKTAPGPELPPEIIRRTAEKYAQAERILTG